MVQAVWHTVQDAGWKNIKINEEDFKKISGLRKKGGFAELADSPKFYLWQGEKKFIIKTNSYRKNLERKERCVRMIEDILKYNKKFVEKKAYEPYLTSKYPDKKLAILTCMDTRLTELLPAALGIKNGDAKIIKNAGGVITHPYGSVMRSLLVGILELGVEEIMVIGHIDCGVQGMDGHHMLEELVERGVSQEHINVIKSTGTDLEKWLGGFESVEQSVKDTVYALKHHPLMPAGIKITGFIMDSVTGGLEAVEEKK